MAINLQFSVDQKCPCAFRKLTPDNFIKMEYVIGTFHLNYVGIDFSVKRDLQDFKMDLSAIKLEFDSCLEFIKYHLKCTSLALVFGGMWESVCAFLSISFILVFCLIANSSRSICLIFLLLYECYFLWFPMWNIHNIETAYKSYFSCSLLELIMLIGSVLKPVYSIMHHHHGLFPMKIL